MERGIELRRAIGGVLLALVLSACAGRPLPQPTPTVAPTRTPSHTPAVTAVAQNPTRTPIPTQTFTPQPSDTPVPPTATDTATATVRPSNTPLPRIEPSRTPTPTLTVTPSPSPTVTPSVSPTPTATDTPQPTATLTPSATPSASATPPPTATDAPIITATAPASPTASNTTTRTALPASPTAAATWTPLPSPTANQPIERPTLDATPTFATLAPNQPTPVGTLPPNTPVQSEGNTAATATPSPAPTVGNVNPPPTIAFDAVLLPPITSIGAARAFALGPGGSGAAFDLPTAADPRLFVRNPRNPSVYVATDALGFYSLIVNGQPQGLPAPFTEFYPESRAANDKLVTDAAWSPDGRFVAFIVDNPDQKQGNDGVWWYEPGVNTPVQVLVNCRPGAPGCAIVQPLGSPYNWHAQSVVWSPDSQRILARLFMYADEFNGQSGALVLERSTDKSVRGHMIPYEYTDWAANSARIIVSGRSSSGQWVFGSVALDGQDFQPAAVSGQYWVQNAVQSGGRLIGLARADGPDGPMRLMDSDGAFLTGDIGTSRPVEVKWNPERSAAYVRTADGRSYLAYVSGQVTDISGQVGDIRAVSWVQGELPPTASAAAIPSGVIEGSIYAPGQQLIVQSTSGGLNLRSEPSTSAGVLVYVTNGSYVAVLAGPTETQSDIGRIVWWRVQIANGTQGWMAGEIGGTATFAVP